jgi:hypothetical protein
MSENTQTINHPAYYGGKDNPYEAIKVIEAWGVNWPPEVRFHVGTALKYLNRAGQKAGEPFAKDLAKAVWYLDRAQAVLAVKGEKK